MNAENFHSPSKGIRTLRSGRGVINLAKSAKLTIETQAPDKWLFVDLETGDIWIKRTEECSTSEYGLDRWSGIKAKEKKELLKIVKSYKTKTI